MEKKMNWNFSAYKDDGSVDTWAIMDICIRDKRIEVCNQSAKSSYSS